MRVRVARSTRFADLQAILPLLAWSLAACGYTFTSARPDGSPHRVFVAPALEPGVDVDAGALVNGSVRAALARSPGMVLAGSEDSEERLEVALVRVDTALAPFAEPGLRAATYEVTVTLSGRLLAKSGETLWSTPAVVGRGLFISPAGRIEALDGATRRGLEDAVEQAAERLVAALGLALRG